MMVQRLDLRRLDISGGRTVMDKITESLLSEFSAEYGLAPLPESKRFEHFATHSVVRREHSETFDTNDLVVGDDNNSKGGGDTGIDAVAIIVNGNLIADIDEFREQAPNAAYLDVSFLLVQAETSSSFDSAKIGSFGFGCRDLFSEQPQLKRNQRISAVAEIVQEIYKYGSKFKKGNPTCKLYYVTTGKWTGEQTPEARISGVKSDLIATGLFKEVTFAPLGAEQIQELYRRTKNAVATDFTFISQVTVKPDIPNIEQAYFGFLPWSEFQKLIIDDSGNFMLRLFFDNVRDWQDYNPINDDIRTTLQSPAKSRFVLMNNGVTVIAKELTRTADKFHIEDYQIVNGCQTSHVLYDQRANLDETVTVPIRLINTKDENVARAIIKATNKQTVVTEEQFFALDEFPKTLEQFFASYPLAQRLYFERRDGQYISMTDIEKTRIITFSNMIRAFAAMFLNEPHRTTRNFAGLKAKVGSEIFSKTHRMEPYYVAALALYRIEFLFRNGKLESKYKPARYHILLALRLMIAGYVMPNVGANAMEPYCKKITDVLQDGWKSEEIITVAAQTVEKAASGNLNRDNIRTEPFTKAVIDEIGTN